MADMAFIIAGNTARFAGGSLPQKRYVEIMGFESHKEERTAEEIINSVIKNAGLEVV